ncbi:hypothetical protein [Planctobacterium marinum]|uniref:MotA/TolQ/ExbB proton channel domain-containing protein n=1 Tax=Planctobacterium marinum TaxID=1631968 RepID=A0AA48HV13_9ALTE|nr:hypothetical protein MACH26_19090 [Planctobacterium marinum]
MSASAISSTFRLGSGIFGILVISLAIISWYSSMNVQEMLLWGQKVFSASFVIGYLVLIGTAAYAWHKIKQSKGNNKSKQSALWFELGQQCGNGLATLALTFTLLGISLGIGVLSEQPLTPETIQSIIQELTRQFSMAFMTTVVGLPSATLVRAIFSVKQQQVAG